MQQPQSVQPAVTRPSVVPPGEGPVADPVRGAVRGERRSVAAAAVLLSGHQLGEAAVPVVIGAAVDDALVHSDAGRLLLWLVVLAADFALLSLCWRFGARRAARVRLGVAHSLRVLVVARVLDGRGMTVRREPGDLLTVAVSDARRVGETVRTLLSSFAGAVVLAGTVGLVAHVSWTLGAVVLCGAVLVLVTVARLSGPVGARSDAEQRATARTAALASDLVAGLRVLAGLRAGPAAARRYRHSSRDAAGHAVRAAQAVGTVDAITALAVGCYLTVVAWTCAELSLRGAFEAGDVIAVLGLSQFVLGPLQSVAAAWPALARGRASALRVRALLGSGAVLGGGGVPGHGAVPGHGGAADTGAVPGGGRVREGGGMPLGAGAAGNGRVSVGGQVPQSETASSYRPAVGGEPGRPDGRDPVGAGPGTAAGIGTGGGPSSVVAPGLCVERLRAPGMPEVSLRVEAGTTAGVAVLSPGAAETLVSVLGGETAPTSGRVRLVDTDGPRDLATLPPDERRGDLLVWPQGALPPGLTVGELLGGGRALAQREALADAAALDVVDRLPEGHASRLTEHGASLSGGERQRLALARLLTERPPLLVLHEPTSSLDAVTEAAVVAGIGRSRRGLTTVLVTTGPAALAACDTVTVIDEDGVRATGEYAELLRTDAQFRAAVTR
ncbi:ABC transporter transmembrane domain-containing protein [Streptomyces sp. NPDC008150]|uniref:ABC transporter transmembrane domain-containing protein n=1 Tax=Streptomyces sp. NPDC008150 TaxID=3364816 RepID=UPI0036E92862